jgi:hypothetical protein
MYSRKINAFLRSMERSCDEFGEGALEERKKLRQVDCVFKAAAAQVRRAISVVPRKAVPSHPKTQLSKRTPRRKPSGESNVVVRPAPFPVKNYMLPARKLVGPRRYFRSRAAQEIRDDDFELQSEIARYPITLGPEPVPEGVSIVVTPALTLAEAPSSLSSTAGHD